MHNLLNKSIEEYTKELMKLYERNEAIPTIATIVDPTTTAPEVPTQEVPMQSSPSLDSDDNFSRFKAQVFSANQAFPVPGAKIKLTRNNELVAFLITEADGQTKEIKIKSPPARNSLDPFSNDQSFDYLADIYADGFIAKKNLLVSAVGDSFAILSLNMTPVSERVS